MVYDVTPHYVKREMAFDRVAMAINTREDVELFRHIIWYSYNSLIAIVVLVVNR